MNDVQVVVWVLPDVLESVAGSSQKECVAFEIHGIERQLEDAGFYRLRNAETD